MNGLFGLELPTPVNFVIAFVVVLALIGAATWLVRRFGAARLDAGGRNRQPRLAVIDSAAVDGRRKLVIIRRDNVEHLLMIGGPTDVVVETNIMRSGAAVPRDAAAARTNGSETLPRVMPLPDAAHWPAQPEPAVPAAAVAAHAAAHAVAPAPFTRPERVRAEEAAQWPTQPEPPPAPTAAQAPPVRVQRDALTGLAADLAQPAPPPAPAPRPAAAALRPVPPPKPASAPVVQIDPQAAAAADQNLANMAHQLEAALRRPAQPPQAVPAVEAPKPAEPRRIEPKLVQRVEPTVRPAPRPAATTAAAATAAAVAAPAAAEHKQPFESLEQEMASLLGRPGKT